MVDINYTDFCYHDGICSRRTLDNIEAVLNCLMGHNIQIYIVHDQLEKK